MGTDTRIRADVLAAARAAELAALRVVADAARVALCGWRDEGATIGILDLHALSAALDALDGE